MMGQIQSALEKLNEMEKMRNQIGMLLDHDIQMKISTVLAADPKAFQRWLMTDAGRTATRQYANAWLGIENATPKDGA